MECSYYVRGKCNNCGEALWTTGLNQSVVCSCSQSAIVDGVPDNLGTLTDEEHIDAFLIEVNIPSQNVILINMS